ISIDVQWAHAIAPGANIKLVLGRSLANEDLVATEKYVVEHDLGDVVSMSFGEVEECEAPSLVAEEHEAFKEGVEHGMTFLSGSGDEGVAPLNCELTEPVSRPVVFIPSSDPNVTGVGGTTLTANLKSGRYIGEAVWNEEFGAGGRSEERRVG